MHRANDSDTWHKQAWFGSIFSCISPTRYLQGKTDILFPKVPYLTLKYVGSLYSTRLMSTNTKILSVVVPICRGSLMRGILIYDGTFTFSIL